MSAAGPDETPLDIERLRADFPLIANSPDCYFDNAATTQKPVAVIEAINNYYRLHNANVHRAAHRLSAEATSLFENARQRVARFINAASSKEIIWTRGTTEGINLVANSWGGSNLGPGDEILISTLEHHANIVPWQLLAQRCGAQIKVIPLLDSGDLDLDAYQQLLGPRTKLVALTQVSNALGTVNPIQTMIEQAHQAGAKVLIDGAQAVSHFAIDVQELDCDFYLFSGHKLYGPTGIGVLYGKQALLEQMPPWQGGGEMIEQVSFEQTQFLPPPLRFEAGTPHIAGAIGLAAAIDYLEFWPLALRQHHELQLLNHAEQRLQAINNVQIIGQPQQRVGLIPFTCQALHSYDLGSLLNSQGIALRTGHHCTMPLHQRLGLQGTARASFALYNRLEEIDRLAQLLEQLLNEPLHPTATKELGSEPGQLCQRLLELKHWKARYSLLMKTAQQAPELSNIRQPENLLHGCSSQVWLTHQFDLKSAKLAFNIDSDTRIIKGLGLLIVELFNDKTAEQIHQLELQPLFSQLGLEQHLSVSRANGVQSIVEAIKRIAQGSP